MPINLQASVSGQAPPVPEPRSVVPFRPVDGVPRQVSSPDGNPVPPEAKAKPVSEDEVARAVRSLNDHVQDLQRSLQFSVDQESGRTVVKVLDTKTNEVIRQIPSEEALTLAHRMREAEGLLLRTRA